MSVSSLVHGDGKFSPPQHRAISLVRTVHAGLHLGHDASIAIVADDLLLLVLEVRARAITTGTPTGTALLCLFCCLPRAGRSVRPLPMTFSHIIAKRRGQHARGIVSDERRPSPPAR